MTSAIRSNKWTNQAQSLLLVIGMGVLMIAIGWLLFGQLGVWIAAGLAVYNLLFGATISPLAVLRAYHAQPLTAYEAPELLSLFSQLVERADLPHPVQLWYVPSQVPNAFAVGTGKDSSVAVTDGLLRLMSQRELAGVLAHELAHVRHRDTTVMGVADTMGRIATGIARFGVLVVLLGLPSLFIGQGLGSWFQAGLLMIGAPLAVFLMQMALSRSREFQADLGASEITGDPLGLAAALVKLEQFQQRGWRGRILKPGQYQLEPSWIRSHPPTGERVRELKEIANSLVTSQVPLSEYRKVDGGKVPLEFHKPVQESPRYHLRSGVWY
ncbi:MAG: zinc metalloprotease HtpX [Planctomycetota bacterium]